MEESVVTETRLPARTGPYAERRGSAFCLTSSTYTIVNERLLKVARGLCLRVATW